MIRHRLLCALASLTFGCNGGSQAPAPSPSPVAGEAAPKEAVEPPEIGALPAAPRTEPPVSDAQTDARPTDLSVVPMPASQGTEPKRDLAKELREAVGSPADCLQDYQPSTAKTIRVRISGIVRPSGLVIEPSVSGTGLSRNDQRCIEERIGAVTLPPLGGSISEPVSTHVDIPYTPPTVDSYDVAPPPPPPEDVVSSLPKKQPITPSGEPIEGPAPKPIEGPSGKPIEGPKPVPIEGPAPVPLGSE